MSKKSTTRSTPASFEPEPESSIVSVEDTIAEIEAKLEELAPQHEGLRDYARLNIKPETLEQVNLAIAEYDQRVALLTAALDPLRALSANGHPDIPSRPVSQLVLDDLNENHDTVTAALTKFTLEQATSLGLESDVTEEK